MAAGALILPPFPFRTAAQTTFTTREMGDSAVRMWTYLGEPRTKSTTATTIAPAGIAMPIVQLWGPAFSWTHTMTVEASRLPMLMKM